MKYMAIFLMATTIAHAELKPNWSSSAYIPNATYNRTEIKYNPYTYQREVTTPNSTLQYNPYTHQRQYVAPYTSGVSKK